MSRPNEPSSAEALRAAEALLFRSERAADGSPARTETPLHRQYLELRAAYEAAKAAFAAAQQEAQRTPAGRGTWPLLAASLQLPVKQAYDRWRSAGAERVEQALAVVERARAAEP